MLLLNQVLKLLSLYSKISSLKQFKKDFENFEDFLLNFLRKLPLGELAMLGRGRAPYPNSDRPYMRAIRVINKE